MEKNKKDIEVIIGDDSELDISQVNDCVNKLRPQDLSKKKKHIIIPTEKKESKK